MELVIADICVIGVCVCTIYSADPLSNFSLTFDTKEEAIAYAVKNGKLLSNTAQCTHATHSERL